MTTSLITGATSGLGAAFARRLAADGHRLVLVARDEDRLARGAKELGARYNSSVETLSADLATEAGIAAVEARLGDPARRVHVLVNSAGFGIRGSFLDAPVTDEIRLLRVHCEAVLRLTAAAVPSMRERRHGFVINVASTAAFMPRGTYGASKAWVVSFTEGIAQELRGSGVRFLALCPGLTRTEFHDRAGMDSTRVPSWAWLNPHRVVATALRDLARGRTLSIPDPRYKLAVALARHTPTPLLTAATRNYDPKP
ncbi:SDR family NAD(P)-dependent oxidoreductase [Streptomyces sp. NBC_01190]|uniref:SDR family NAD(P)-dependent oxidoreductase n=1 Tax=Streptomyces sp. NBC_01190 TaxID=2903767 RepID=UPI0038630847|nr:SDR family oxidoreductase [Streptomyces sp. NBC_01190]